MDDDEQIATSTFSEHALIEHLVWLGIDLHDCDLEVIDFEHDPMATSTLRWPKRGMA
jgi:hypothetical protein